MQFLERVRKAIEREHLLALGDAIVIGVSGGPDSLCLLHVLCRLRPDYELALHVAHLNHRLRGAEADADAEFVAQLAREWGLGATVESRDVAALAKGRRLAIEEAARQARYAFLAGVAQQVGACKIAVGHNADDQVETVLMHWLRGAGLAGLRGMQALSRLDDLRLVEQGANAGSKVTDLLLIRPLLQVQRADIEAYCAAHDLRPRFDRSNLDTTYHRNRLRHELLPFLETFNPRIRDVILRSSAIISAEHDYLRQQAMQAWANVTVSQSEHAVVFDLQKWRKLPLAMQRSAVREAIHCLRRSLRNINWVHVDNAIQVLRQGTTGMAVTLPRGLQARLAYDRFTVAGEDYAEPQPDMPLLCGEEVRLHIPGRTQLPHSVWSVSAGLVASPTFKVDALRPASPWQAYLDYDVTGAELRLRPRRTGDRFWPQGLGDRPTTVHNFMTNAKMPRAWRDSIPLLVSPSQVLWIAGWRIDERAKVTQATRRVLSLSFTREREPLEEEKPGFSQKPGF